MPRIITNSPQCPGAAATAQGGGSKPCQGRSWRRGILLCSVVRSLHQHSLPMGSWLWDIKEPGGCFWSSEVGVGSPGALLGVSTALGGTVALQGCWAAHTTVMSNTETLSLLQHSKVVLAPFQCFLGTPSSGILLSSWNPSAWVWRIYWVVVTYQLGVGLCN